MVSMLLYVVGRRLTYLPFDDRCSLEPRLRTLRIDAINLVWKLSAARPILGLFLVRTRSGCRNLSMANMEQAITPLAENGRVTRRTGQDEGGWHSNGTRRPTAPESCSPASAARCSGTAQEEEETVGRARPGVCCGARMTAAAACVLGWRRPLVVGKQAKPPSSGSAAIGARTPRGQSETSKSGARRSSLN